jgi:GNAT superfamily N-acetyltransferase
LYIERIDKRHKRGEFVCGRVELDEWLATKARKADQRDASSRVFVLTDDSGTVFGYYAMAAHAVLYDEAPPYQVTGFPKHHVVPSVLLSRLAVASNHQGRGLGQRLLADAVRRVCAIDEGAAVRLMVLDALDAEAAGFYEQFGFVRWPPESMKLFGRLKDLRQTFSI